MKLSKRLAAIDALITRQQNTIWDCCCDHGYLGMALLKRSAADKVMFVDILSNVMADLEATLTRNKKLRTPGDKKPEWQVLCQDVGGIKLDDVANQVVVIAGIGGELALRLVQQIIANNSPESVKHVRFILCPIHHTYLLRSGLHTLNLGLHSEHIISDKNRIYELIEVSFKSNQTVSKTGDAMWDLNNKQHTAYIQRLLNHYNKMLNKDELYYQKVISDYQSLYDS